MRYDIVALTLHCSNTHGCFLLVTLDIGIWCMVPWKFGIYGYRNGAWFPESLVSMDIGMPNMWRMTHY